MRYLLIICGFVACAALAGCGGAGGFGSGESTSATGFGGFGGSMSQPVNTATSSLASSFWEIDRLREAPKVEPGVQTTEHTAAGDVAVQEILYDCPGASGKSLRIFAYYGYPAAKSADRLPAVIIVHGGMGRADKSAVVEWASRGYAALAMDLPGKGNGRDGSKSEGPDMADPVIFSVSPSPKDSFIYAAVNSVCRAVSVMSIAKQVDASRIGVVGSSWGGVITLIANGIDSRISAACTIYGAGYVTEESCWLANGNLKHLTAKQVQSWREHFDPSSYVASQCGKMLFVGATQDAYYPLRSFLRTYEGAKCEKALCLIPNTNHAMDDTARANVAKWFDWALRSGPALPALKVASAAGKLKVSASGTRPVTAVSLLTADGTTYQQATWKPVELTGEDGKWTTDAPQPDTPYYLTARDDSGALIAAEVHLPKAK